MKFHIVGECEPLIEKNYIFNMNLNISNPNILQRLRFVYSDKIFRCKEVKNILIFASLLLCTQLWNCL